MNDAADSESALCHLTPKRRWNTWKTRAEDLSQARPEYNHATNAVVLVGNRWWSRNLFLDRRAFLQSITIRIQDDANTTSWHACWRR